MLKPDVSQWLGRTQTECDVLAPNVLNMLNAALCDADFELAKNDAPLEPLAHWCAFTPRVPMGQIATDGHAKLGGFMPPAQLPRRMWAGGKLEFHAPLHVGTEITRQSTILSVVEKEGASGPMTFVTVGHELSQDGIKCLSERQDIVYLDIPETYAPPRKTPVSVDPDLQVAVEMSAARLFRFSAATFNAHRIHYDLAYAQEVEKYPGLVVHGPLQAMLLLRAAMEHAGRAPRSFSFRGVHPMFHFDDLHLFGTFTADGMTLCTGVPESHQGMQAKVIWEETE